MNNLHVNSIQDWKRFNMPPVRLPEIPDRSVSIMDFGAVGDGFTDNTEAINKAIQHMAKQGGGRVIIPKGVWLTGPIVFQSRIELHTEAGALIMFSKNFDDYPLVLSSFEGRQTVRCRSPLDAESAEHIAITGDGIFDGGGEVWRPVKKWKMTENQWNRLVASGGVVDDSGTTWYPSEAAWKGGALVEELFAKEIHDPEAYKPVRDFLRPNMLSFRFCKYILLDGPTFQNSAAWCLHPWASEHITVRNVRVRNPWYSQNGDGLDVESCKYVLIENSTFDVGDDAICLKSGKDEPGRKLGMPSEYIHVRNCTVYHGHGGIVVGSEMSGGVRNVRVTDCTFIGTDIGIRFKSCRGRGGVVENIVIEDIRMKEIDGDAISFNLYYDYREGSGEYGGDEKHPVSEETPIFRKIYIKDIVCRGAVKAVLINGLPEMPIDQITMVNLKILSEEGIVCRNACNVEFSNVTVQTSKGKAALFHQCANVNIDEMHLTTEKAEDQIVEITGPETKQIQINGLTPSLELKLAAEVNEEQVVRS
ncbi:glycoside hydrolase [Insulibacter thermoxylanivorax]|uniref:Glycoside hydrolase n=2 Tax=Insulibacter thermoxylanivorax TaxID=2749268 RepID=A0A916QCQ1_9BACL|nr:glycoside hydrolase [Insulibacter thermoxylanivorax]